MCGGNWQIIVLMSGDVMFLIRSIAVSLILALLSPGCTRAVNQKEAARMRLEHSNVPFTDDAFIQNVIKGNVAEVELFLSAGMDPNTRFKGNEFTIGNLVIGSGDTALIIATGLNHAGIIHSLLDHNANPNERGLNQRTALMLAKSNTAQLLVENQAEVNAKGSSGWTALMSAAANDDPETIELFLKHGAEINAKLDDGGTALMIAAFEGRAQSLRTLIMRGADRNAKTSDGKTALRIAKENNRTEIVEILTNTTVSGG